MDTIDEETVIHKRFINDGAMKTFREILHSSNWELVTQNEDPEFSYHTFEEIFTRAYKKAFPKEKVIIKPKTLKTPWMTKGF